MDLSKLPNIGPAITREQFFPDRRPPSRRDFLPVADPQDTIAAFWWEILRDSQAVLRWLREDVSSHWLRPSPHNSEVARLVGPLTAQIIFAANVLLPPEKRFPNLSWPEFCRLRLPQPEQNPFGIPFEVPPRRFKNQLAFLWRKYIIEVTTQFVHIGPDQVRFDPKDVISVECESLDFENGAFLVPPRFDLPFAPGMRIPTRTKKRAVEFYRLPAPTGNPFWRCAIVGYDIRAPKWQRRELLNRKFKARFDEEKATKGRILFGPSAQPLELPQFARVLPRAPLLAVAAWRWAELSYQARKTPSWEEFRKRVPSARGLTLKTIGTRGPRMRASIEALHAALAGEPKSAQTGQNGEDGLSSMDQCPAAPMRPS